MWQLKFVLQKYIFIQAYFSHKTSGSFNIQQDGKPFYLQELISFLLLLL